MHVGDRDVEAGEIAPATEVADASHVEPAPRAVGRSDAGVRQAHFSASTEHLALDPAAQIGETAGAELAHGLRGRRFGTERRSRDAIDVGSLMPSRQGRRDALRRVRAARSEARVRRSDERIDERSDRRVLTIAGQLLELRDARTHVLEPRAPPFELAEVPVHLAEDPTRRFVDARTEIHEPASIGKEGTERFEDVRRRAQRGAGPKHVRSLRPLALEDRVLLGERAPKARLRELVDPRGDVAAECLDAGEVYGDVSLEPREDRAERTDVVWPRREREHHCAEREQLIADRPHAFVDQRREVHRAPRILGITLSSVPSADEPRELSEVSQHVDEQVARVVDLVERASLEPPLDPVEERHGVVRQLVTEALPADVLVPADLERLGSSLEASPRDELVEIARERLIIAGALDERERTRDRSLDVLVERLELVRAAEEEHGVKDRDVDGSPLRDDRARHRMIEGAEQEGRRTAVQRVRRVGPARAKGTRSGNLFGLQRHRRTPITALGLCGNARGSIPRVHVIVGRAMSGPLGADLEQLVAGTPGLFAALNALLDRAERRGGRLPARITLDVAPPVAEALRRLFSARAVTVVDGGRARLELATFLKDRGRGAEAALLRSLYAVAKRAPRDPVVDDRAIRHALERSLVALEPLAKTAASRAFVRAELAGLASAADDAPLVARAVASGVVAADRLVADVACAIDAVIEHRESAGDEVRIQVFSARVLGSSKALRPGGELHRRLTEALLAHDPFTVRAMDELGLALTPASAQKFALGLSGVLYDEAASSVLCFGPIAYTKRGAALRFDHVARHAEIGESSRILLQQLRDSRIERPPAHRVTVLENLAPYLDYVDACIASAANDEIVVCSGGQASLAVVALLRRLAAHGLPIRHAGDLDRSGILILRSLASRSGASIAPLLMSAATHRRFAERGRRIGPDELGRLGAFVRASHPSSPCHDLSGELLASGVWIEQEAFFDEVLAEIRGP